MCSKVQKNSPEVYQNIPVTPFCNSISIAKDESHVSISQSPLTVQSEDNSMTMFQKLCVGEIGDVTSSALFLAKQVKQAKLANFLMEFI